MRRPSKTAKPTRAAPRPSARLLAGDLARVRAIAATANVRASSRRKVLLFGGANAMAAAELLAKRLQRELHRVDLSTIVSKDIGETEKNLGRVFAEATAASAILLFDEADALFGQRTSVKDSHDRYSNIEIGYLLQRAEAHDGSVILASKLELTLPIALWRRIAIYHFPPR
jgi:SpoVK/Ycf46/Vps4 family AAA+-type ATPase